MKNKFPRIIIAGTHSGVGKTTIAIGIMSALVQRGYKVQPFKVGPDYIDPTYHTYVTGRASRNLDTWMMGEAGVKKSFLNSASSADISIIEGVMGLYDGFSGSDERGSTAHLAKLLATPVLLVVDGRSMARSAGALVLGYKNFDPGVNIMGVIVNNIASPRHLKYVKESIEKYARVKVIGHLFRNEHMKIKERHLGLIPEQEIRGGEDRYGFIRQMIEENVDIDEVVRIAEKNKGRHVCLEEASFVRAGMVSEGRASAKTECGLTRRGKQASDERQAGLPLLPTPITIGVARDKAFSFYYQDNLDLLENHGAKLVYFSPMSDISLPEGLDLLYIGGGFPEVFAKELSMNKKMLKDIKRFGGNGGHIYAECGGLMYLCEGIKTFDGKTHKMVGLVPRTAVMNNKRMALGYIKIKALKENILMPKGFSIKAHEFHWSSLDGNKRIDYAYTISKGDGIEEKKDGIIIRNILASYSHVHFGQDKRLVEHLINSAKGIK